VGVGFGTGRIYDHVVVAFTATPLTLLGQYRTLKRCSTTVRDWYLANLWSAGVQSPAIVRSHALFNGSSGDRPEGYFYAAGMPIASGHEDQHRRKCPHQLAQSEPEEGVLCLELQ